MPEGVRCTYGALWADRVAGNGECAAFSYPKGFAWGVRLKKTSQHGVKVRMNGRAIPNGLKRLD